MEKDYSIFLGEIKSQILLSQYKAAAAVNRELILLYFQVGTQLSQKIAQAQWGSKVVQQLAKDLQREINGLRGFSYSNLKNMRQFADAYPHLLQKWTPKSIGQLPIGQLKDFSQSSTGQKDAFENELLQLATAQFESTDRFLSEVFFNISFTQ